MIKLRVKVQGRTIKLRVWRRGKQSGSGRGQGQKDKAAGVVQG